MLQRFYAQRRRSIALPLSCPAWRACFFALLHTPVEQLGTLALAAELGNSCHLSNEAKNVVLPSCTSDDCCPAVATASGPITLPVVVCMCHIPNVSPFPKIFTLYGLVGRTIPLTASNSHDTSFRYIPCQGTVVVDQRLSTN